MSRLALLPVIVLAVLAGVLGLQIHYLESSSSWVDRTDVVIAKMNGLLRLFIDEETGLRGYLLTGQSEFLEPYNRGRSEIDARFAELEQLVSDSPQQRERLRVLAQEHKEWVEGAAQRLGTLKTREQVVADALESKRRTDHIRTLAAQFLKEEDAQREIKSSHSTFISGITLAILFVVAVLAAGAIIFYTSRLNQSREMFRALASQHSENAKTLRESEVRYRALFDSIDEGFCIVQMIFDESGRPIDYRFLEINPSFEQLTGLRDARGKTVRELSPHHEQHWIDTYGEIALTGEPARFQDHDNQLHRWYDVYASRLAPPEERRVAILFNDITSRKSSDHALRESEERFRAIYERAPIGIEQVAPDGRLMMVNSKQCAMLGYSESQLLSKTFEDITHPEDRAKEADLLKSLFSGEQDSYTLEKRYLHKSGAIVWVNITSTIVRNQSGSPEYRITVVEDVTARKHAEQALIRAEKLAATGRMASTMAHEINNPLAAALNSLYLATLDEGVSEATSQYLDLAQRELLRVAQITKQTLGFYRETGLPTKVNLREVASSVVDLYKPKLRNKDIKVELRCPNDASIFGVEGEVQQIISNLLSNSIDAVSQQGCIRLRVEGPMTLDGSRPLMRLTIADNGGGIQPQHLSQIFEPFFSTKDSTGTGLGLWVTQQLVKKQLGKIRARSKVGMGTVFQVLLPLERRSLKVLSPEHEVQDVKATA